MTPAPRPRRGTTGTPAAARRARRGRGAAVLGLGLAAAALALAGARGLSAPGGGPADRWAWTLPANMPVPRVPASNPMTRPKVELGRYLFYERRLSANGTQACSSCHLQALAFTDGRARAVGSTGEEHPRSAPSLANVAYNATLAWANPALVSLERQAVVPIFGEHPVEMGVTDRTKGAVLRRLARDPGYRRRFRAAFPGQPSPVTWANIVKAIASFERTMVSGNSRYDRYLAGRARLTPAETRGMELFFGERAECHHCHSGFNLNDSAVHARSRPEPLLFHNTGLYNVGGTGAYAEPSQGLAEVTGRAEDTGRFRAPTLRNVEVTAPYMHDGSIATLRQVVDTYAAGGRNIVDGPNAGDGRLNPYKSDLITGIVLSEREREDIVAFLLTLTDRDFLRDPRLSDPFARARR